MLTRVRKDVLKICFFLSHPIGGVHPAGVSGAGKPKANRATTKKKKLPLILA